MGKLSASLSTIAGILPLGLIARNLGFFCSFSIKLTTCISYSNSIASKVHETLWPLGVGAVYRSIMLSP